MVIAIAGIGALFGLTVTPLFAVILLAVLSIYDIIAVYKTKHMISMAKAMIESKAIFGFVIPSKLKLVTERLNNVTPGDNFMILGSGDIVMPLILTSSVAKTSLAGSVIVLIFSLAGLFLTHLIFTNQNKKRPMAALPPIAALSIIGYLIFYIII